jgi:two-component system, sensor histidine kinase PdtaS
VPWVARLSRLPAPKSGLQSWVLAVALAAAATGLRLALGSWMEPTRFVSFFIAVGVAAFLCGWRQAALVLLLSIVAVYYLFMPYAPEGPLDYAHVAATIGICLVAGGFQITLVSGLRNLIDRLNRLNSVQDTLFRELQHRVANNMQIIAGMLRTTQRNISDPIALEMIDQAAARIDSLAKLHRQLYSLSAYDAGLKPVLQNVLAECFHGLPVKFEIEIGPNHLSIDQMTAIVLLVNEAALNAVKHVFRPVQGTVFAVALRERPNGKLLLTITDDGPGIAPVRQPSNQSRTLGMSIMQGFAQQLGGRLEMPSGMPGTTLQVEFVNG